MAGRTSIGRFLKSRGSSQVEAAKVLGITTACMSSKAKGRTSFKQSEIKKLAEHYAMTSEEVYQVFVEGVSYE